MLALPKKPTMDPLFVRLPLSFARLRLFSGEVWIAWALAVMPLVAKAWIVTSCFQLETKFGCA